MLIVISGPIASGKSTVARGVAEQLQRSGVATQVVDLDELYAAQTRTRLDTRGDAARWRAARHDAARRAASLRAEGVSAVIVEGSFQAARDRLPFRRSSRLPSDTLFVTLRVAYEEALRRAQKDPTRGRSREPRFLRQYYDDALTKLANPPSGDLVIDTEAFSERQVVAEVVAAALDHAGRRGLALKSSGARSA